MRRRPRASDLADGGVERSKSGLLRSVHLGHRGCRGPAAGGRCCGRPRGCVGIPQDRLLDRRSRVRSAAETKKRVSAMMVMVRLLDTRVTVDDTRAVFGGRDISATSRRIRASSPPPPTRTSATRGTCLRTRSTTSRRSSTRLIGSKRLMHPMTKSSRVSPRLSRGIADWRIARSISSRSNRPERRRESERASVISPASLPRHAPRRSPRASALRRTARDRARS